MEIRVAVTQEDIDNGQRGCGYECPVSLAVARALRKLRVRFAAVHVMRQDIAVYFYGQAPTWCFPTPVNTARAFIRYDEGNEMHPFSFTLYDRYHIIKPPSYYIYN